MWDVACGNVFLVLQGLCVFVSWGIESFPCQCSAPYTLGWTPEVKAFKHGLEVADVGRVDAFGRVVFIAEGLADGIDGDRGYCVS